MRKKFLFIAALCIVLLSACGQKSVQSTQSNVPQAVQSEQETAGAPAVGGAGTVSENTAATTHTPQKIEQAEQSEETGPRQVVGGISSILGLDESQADAAAAIADSIDMDEVENMTDEEKEALAAQIESLAQQHDIVLASLTDALERANIAVNIDKTTGKITMENGILFATNESEVSQDGKAFLDSFIKAYADGVLNADYADFISEIRIEGNADTDGDYDYNMELSKKRAEAVKAYCLESTKNSLTDEQRTQLTDMLKTIGNSYDNPVYNEDGSVNKDASRRVEFKFMMNIGD